MLLVELAFALVAGLVLAGVLGLILGTAALGGFLWFFLVVFLGAWAIGTWATPVGPVLWGVSWAPFVLGALAIALLVAAFPRPRPATPEEAAEAKAAATLGGFFWAFVLVMMLFIALGPS